MRQTTTWLVGGAAAVGAVVVAGLNLSSLPPWGYPVGVGVGGFLLALVGVGFILVQAANVLALGFGGFADLVALKLADSDAIASAKPGRHRSRAAKRRAKFIARLDKEIPMLSQGRATDVSNLWRKLDEAYTGLIGLTKDGGATVQVDGRSFISSNRADLEVLAESLELAALKIVDLANQRRTEAEFGRLRVRLIVGGLLVAIGVAVFVVAPKMPAASKPMVTSPTLVLLDVSAPHRFGARCKARTLHGVALSGPWDSPTVVTVATKRCRGRELVVTPSVGHAVPQIARGG
jgi:hypothetical protein